MFCEIICFYFFLSFICHTIFIGMEMYQWWWENQQVCIRNLLHLLYPGISACIVSTASAKVCLQLLATGFLYKPTVAVLYHCYTSWVYLVQKCFLSLELPREPGLPPSGQERNLVHWLLGVGMRAVGASKRERKGRVCEQLTHRSWSFTSITKDS